MPIEIECRVLTMRGYEIKKQNFKFQSGNCNYNLKTESRVKMINLHSQKAQTQREFTRTLTQIKKNTFNILKRKQSNYNSYIMWQYVTDIYRSSKL